MPLKECSEGIYPLLEAGLRACNHWEMIHWEMGNHWEIIGKSLLQISLALEGDFFFHFTFHFIQKTPPTE